MVTVSAQEQLTIFAGLVYVLPKNRVRIPDGRLVDQKRFNVLFPGSYAAGCGRSTKAWFAFVHNQEYRCPISLE